MISTLRLISALLAAAALLALVPAAHAATTSELIDAAQERGDLTDGQAALLRLRAVGDWTSLPEEFKGEEFEEGTIMLLQAQQALEKGEIESPAVRERVADRLGRRRAPGTTCYDSTVELPLEHDTAHFRFEYDPGHITLAEVQNYGTSLEHAYQRHITEFGWAPPVIKASPNTGGRLVVRIDPGLDATNILGYVSNGGTHAGLVGDNPATPWNEGDAYASCMVLRSDYSASGGEAQMRATTHHEFHHMVQYGLGAAVGGPDLIFMEGGAKWIEDELDDDANRMHLYRWADMRFPMGHYTSSQGPYAYWLVWRGITERYGQAVAGGAENVMQRFWENVSKGMGQTPALEQAVADGADDLTLARAFHDTSIANRFLTQCGGLYALPLCFTEGAQTLAANAGVNPYPPVDSPVITTLGTRHAGGIYPDYAAVRVRLPSGSTPYQVAFSNNDPAAPGPLFASVACDTGTSVRVQHLGPSVPRGEARGGTFDPTGCGDVVLSVTNPNVTSPNPTAFGTQQQFDVATGTNESPLTVRVTGAGKVTSAPAGIDCASDCLEWYPGGQQVTLTATPTAGSGKVFRGWSGACTGLGPCQVTMSAIRDVTATFGDPRPTTTTLSCAPGNVLVGGTATCTATVADPGASPLSPNGTVTFSGGGTATFGSGGSCTLAGTPRQCSVTYTPTGTAGTRTITATYGANGPHAGSSDTESVHFGEKRATSTTVVCTPASVIVSVATTCTGTVADTAAGTAIRPTGTITFTRTGGSFGNGSSCELPATGATACSVTFTPSGTGALPVSGAYAGDNAHHASSGNGALTATKRPTSTAVACAPASVIVGTSTKCTATVADTGAGTKTAPTGAVAFSGGQTCQLSGAGDGTCSIDLQGASAGTQNVVATYAGDALHDGSTEDASFSVTAPPAPPGDTPPGTTPPGDATPPPGQGPTPGPTIVPDTFAPVFGPLSAPRTKLARFATGGLTIALSLSEPSTVVGELSVDRATAKRLKLTKRVIAQGTAAAGVTSLVLKPDRKVARKVKRQKRLRATLKVVATDAAGNATTRTLVVTLKR